MNAIDWGIIDPADWEPEPPVEPEPEVDPELAWLYAMRLLVRDRQARMQRARAAMRKARDEWTVARDEMVAAARMLEIDGRTYAARLGVTK